MNSTVLLDQLKSPDPALREDAVLKIGNSFDTRLLEPLAAMATPEEPDLELLFVKYLQNLPPEISFSYFLLVSQSPNEATKKNVFGVLDQVEWEQDQGMINKILSRDDTPLLLFALKKLESSGRKNLLSSVAPLLSSSSREVAAASFRLITIWNFHGSVPLLLPFLKAEEPFRQILALTALGRLSAFTQWRRFLPFLTSPEPEVRKAAVQGIHLCKGTPPYAIFLKTLKKEKDTEVMKELIAALKGVQKNAVIREFIHLAALHTEPGVRKMSNWAVNEYRGKQLVKSIMKMFDPAEEQLCRFLITKIGELKVTGCGHLVVSFLDGKSPAPLKYAALESLCLLKDKKYLDLLKPYITSDDPMEAYLGTLAAANTVSSLDECSDLEDIFFSSDPGKEVLKQVLLELMNAHITWDIHDKTILGALEKNLDNTDTNTRYLSVFLIKKTRDQSFVPLLTRKTAEDPDEAVRDAMVQCIDTLLGGDVGYYLEQLSSRLLDEEQEGFIINLLLKLTWNKQNALKGIIFFGAERYQNLTQLMPLGARLYAVCPREIEEFVQQEKEVTPWLLALSQAWLTAINPLNTEANKGHWFTLLSKKIPGLQALLAQKAVENKSSWAVEPLQQSLDWITDPDAVKLTKRAVKTILEM